MSTTVQPKASTAMPDPRAKRTATEAFEALVAEHHLQVEEWDPSTLDEGLRDKFMGLYGEIDGTRILVVPAGQDPVIRLAVVRQLLACPVVTA